MDSRGGGAEIIKRGMFIRLERSLSQPEIALSRIGALVTSRSQKAFDLQSRFGRQWPPRWTPNVPGILSDLDRGVSVKERRLRRGPALMDTGRLRQSIQWRIESADTVAIGTNIPYAKKHQFGLADSITVTQRMRDGLAKFLRSSRGRPFRDALGWIFGMKAIDFLIRKRPFIGVDDLDMKDVRRIIREELPGRR